MADNKTKEKSLEEILGLEDEEGTEVTASKPVVSQPSKTAKPVKDGTQVASSTEILKIKEEKSDVLSIIDSDSDLEEEKSEESFSKNDTEEDGSPNVILKIFKILIFLSIISILFIAGLYKGTPILLGILVKKGIIKTDNKAINELIARTSGNDHLFSATLPGVDINVVKNGFIRTMDDKSILIIEGEIQFKEKEKKIFISLYDDKKEAAGNEEIIVGKIISTSGLRFIKNKEELQKIVQEMRQKIVEPATEQQFFTIFYDIPIKEYYPQFAISEDSF